MGVTDSNYGGMHTNEKLIRSTFLEYQLLAIIGKQDKIVKS